VSLLPPKSGHTTPFRVIITFRRVRSPPDFERVISSNSALVGLLAVTASFIVAAVPCVAQREADPLLLMAIMPVTCGFFVSIPAVPASDIPYGIILWRLESELMDES
jgi:hypothetical protein